MSVQSTKFDEKTIMKGVREFVANKIKNEQQRTELGVSIRNLDAQKRRFHESIQKYMKANQLDSFQIQKNNNEFIQARVKNLYTYEILTSAMAQHANIDWARVKSMEISIVIPYIFNALQKTRRSSKQSIEVKESGKRNQKKLPLVTDRSITDSILNAYDLRTQSKQLRSKRRAMDMLNDDYHQTLQFLESRKLKAQTFNIRGGAGEGRKKLLVRRGVVHSATTLPGRDLRNMIVECVQKNLHTQSKETFIRQLMDLVVKHQSTRKQKRERLYYEIQ